MTYQQEQPLTSARLASSLELKLMIPIQLNLGFGVAFEWEPGRTLGRIGSMVRDQTREIHRRYTLGSHSMEPLDLIPNKVTTNLRLEKVVMYSEYFVTPGSILSIFGIQNPSLLSEGDLLGALGYISGNLFFQQFPFAIQETVHPPIGSGSGPTITSYYDCWLRTNPIEYDLMGADQLVLQECEVACGRVTTSIPIEKAVVPLIRRLLPKAIQIGRF
jgi:hypothetical protein